MSKSNKNKPIQLLSPENYIRQKARNLPIYECKVNIGWERDKMAQVLVARSHANGNISLCFYLVDLGCLGVKDTFFQFNIKSVEYSELLERFDDEMSMKVISYELAHNIVYGGVQFAEEFGFKPHKDFTSVTRFMLEEDADDIELIEIKLGGKDGNPWYVNSGHESETRAKQILSQLEKTAGKGNYNYILRVEEEDLEEEEDRDNEFSEFMLDKMKVEFLTLMKKKINKLSPVEKSKLIHLSNDIYTEICNETQVYDYIDGWENEYDIEITTEYTNEFIGVDENFVVTAKQIDLIDEILSLFGENDKKAKKKLIELEKQIGKTSLIAFMELELLKFSSIKDFKAKLADYSLIYPNCSLIKMMSHLEEFINKKDADLIQYMPDSDFIFKGRSSVTEYEMTRYLTAKFVIITKFEDINLTQAFYLHLDDLTLSEEAHETIKGIASILRLTLLTNYFENH
ncbi:MAG: hypothetical protein Q7U47_12545 [Paludibacter sp.]|nr:hypothetical protein [Paludibacter sp.]